MSNTAVFFLCLASLIVGEFIGAFCVLFFMGSFRTRDDEEPEESDNVILFRKLDSV
jgi:hypothetical protein